MGSTGSFCRYRICSSVGRFTGSSSDNALRQGKKAEKQIFINVKVGDMIVVAEKHRLVYNTSYHTGVIISEGTPDPYFGARRLNVLWNSGEVGTYVETTLEGAWEVTSVR